MGALQDSGHLWRLFILWLHLCGVVVWIGGLLWSTLAVAAGMPRLSSVTQHLRFTLSLEVRFHKVMWPAVGVVLFTGLVNVMNVLSGTVLVGERLPAAFVQVLSIKLSLVGGMLIMHAVQQWVVQPRRVAWLGRLEAAALELPPGLSRLQHMALALRLATLALAAVVLFVALFLRGL